MKYSKRYGIAILSLSVFFSQYSSAQIRKKRSTKQNYSVKVDALTRKMTLDEKLGQMYQCLGRGKFSVGEVQKIQDLNKLIRGGKVGSILVPGEANDVYEMQRIAVEESRLKIPLFFNMDVIHGYKTIFPIPLAMAGTFNPELVQRAHRVAATEASYDGINYNHGPMADVPRDPRWGRVMESNGEDPYLDQVMTKAAINGFQNYNLMDPASIMATAKHFIGYGASEGGKDYNSVDISETTLYNIHLPGFEAAVNSGVSSIMTSFNTIDNIPTVANKHLLREILREHLGFKGIIISDFGTISELVHHGYAKDNREAAQLAIRAGIDIEMQSENYKKFLPGLIKSKLVDMKLIDEAVRRILIAKYEMGLFENPYRLTGRDSLDHFVLGISARKSARAVADESIVLLKNEKYGQHKLLPLAGVGNLAIIGPFADAKGILGRWSAKGDTAQAISLAQGIKNRFGDLMHISVAAGCAYETPDTSSFLAAVNLAMQSDVVMLALGEPETMSGEATSRAGIRLPEVQLRLAERIVKTGKPVIVVLFNGRPLDLRWFDENVPAIIEAYYPGTEGGNALADVISGDISPSGKLTMSFPRDVGQIPIYYNHLSTGKYYEKNGRYALKYTDLPDGPLYPFGYGLSYASFKYGKPEAIPSGKNNWVVSVELENTGKCSAREVTQLYIHDRYGSNSRPVIELKDFKKSQLKPGEKIILRFIISPKQMRYWSSAFKRKVVEKGIYDIGVGTDSEHLQYTTIQLQ